MRRLKISHTRLQLGEFKSKIFVQHLSPNRALA